MNLSYYIARRLISQRDLKSSIAGPILKIAIAAVAVGLIMMIIAIATSIGLKTKIREKIAAFNGHVQITNFDYNQSEISTAPISRNQDFYPNFKEVQGIKHIQGVAVKAGIIRTEETFEGILAKGVSSDFNWTPFEEFIIQGRLPKFSEGLNNEIIISNYLSNRLKLNVGDEVHSVFLKDNDASRPPNNRRFQLVGIYDSGFEEFDQNIVLIDLRHIQKMNKWTEDEIGHFEVFLENFDDMEDKTNEIYGSVLSTLNTKNIGNKYPVIFEWLELFDLNVILIISIMVIVGGINMITALLVLILERTPMIGTLKAMGAQNWTIRKVFLLNAAYLIGWGLLIGNVVGYGLVFLQQQFGFLEFPNPEQYYVREIPVVISLQSLLMLNVGVMLLCLLMLLLPSYAISKISPVKAIRFR